MKNIFFICLIVFSSCSQKWCACHYPQVIHDSITSITQIDTFYVPVNADTSVYSIPFVIKDYPDTLLRVDGKKNGLLIVANNHVLQVRDIQKKDSLQGINITKSTQQIETINVPYPVIKTKAPKWAWWVLASLVALLVINIAYITIKITK